jgi:hypothetical protein
MIYGLLAAWYNLKVETVWNSMTCLMYSVKYIKLTSLPTSSNAVCINKNLFTFSYP